MPFKVIVADNFHHGDSSYNCTVGPFPSEELAIEEAKRIVDAFLEDSYKPGMSVVELYEFYTTFGEDPYIQSTDGAGSAFFSAWSYAKERCQEICSSDKKDADGQGCEG